jgi:hypothetical protein
LGEHTEELEEKLQLIRDSFGMDKCQCLNPFTRDLLTQAIETQIKECVLGHDYRGKNKRQQSDESRQAAQENIRLYEELLKQLQALPLRD